MSLRWFLSVLTAGILAIAGCASSTVWATPQFPSVIRTTYGTNLTRDCSICHRNGKPGAAAVKTPFALTMKAQGLVKYRVPSLRAALLKVEVAGTDSDLDGVSDIDELRADTNPNLGPGEDLGLGEPRYGCGASVVPAWLPALALLLLARVWPSRRP